MSRIHESDHAEEFDNVKNEELTPSDRKSSPAKLSNSHETQEEENYQVSDEIISQNNTSKQKSIINNILYIISFPWYMLKILINLLFRGKWKLKTLHCFENFFMLYSRFVFRNSIVVVFVISIICLLLGIGKFCKEPTFR
ncbi:hypothetical protein ACR3K2_27780 [Cryptosporidium serpentis]